MALIRVRVNTLDTATRRESTAVSVIMSEQNTYEPLIDVNEAVQLLGISTRALRESKYRNQSPPYYKLAKNIVRYKPSEIITWLKSKREES